MLCAIKTRGTIVNIHTDRVLGEIAACLDQVPEQQLEGLIERLVAANRIFVAGCGRSGLVAKSFAMRLMHLGFVVYSLGETVTPAVQQDDFLLVISASGNTASLTGVAQTAKKQGCAVNLITGAHTSSIANTADFVLELAVASAQPMGSLFEQCAWILLDSTVLKIMEHSGITQEQMRQRHANLE